MAAYRSFIYTSATRPPRYRTPSPPRDAVEPISPYLDHSDWPQPDTSDHFDSQQPFGKLQFSGEPTDAYNNGPDLWHDSGERRHRSGAVKHSRSRSTIDTLATIALATSPTFTSPPLATDSPQSIQNGKLEFGGPEDNERPAKRARSEKAPSPVLHRTNDRPATSHVVSYEVAREDVELLLNFARPDNIVTFKNDSESPNGGEPDGLAATNGNLENMIPDGQDEHSEYSHRESDVVQKPFQNQRRLSLLHSKSEDNFQNKAAAPESLHQTQPTVKESSDLAIFNDSSITCNDSHEDRFEPELNDMATATCAKCHSAWIDENGSSATETTWIRCDGCKRWFHLSCTEVRDEEVNNIDKFNCVECIPTYGPTTYVRKSTRNRTNIDYAGLNQGVVKASVDGTAHHYIQPIKDGTIKFTPESFPRMRAELVTAEYFEKCGGMKEPVVIPASLNSGIPGDTTNDDESEADYPFYDDSSVELGCSDDEAEAEEVIDCGQDGLGMVIPRNLTVKNVAELYGPNEFVEVIDVKSQQGEIGKCTMQQWADYYESESNSKVIRNVISLEVSQSRLGRLIRRPTIVRDLDLQDSVWPENQKGFPRVQFYCLMSVADCFTDFHIDFGGSSVYYHILKGRKTFFFIPPKEKYLKKYEDWCNSKDQDTVFLGNETKECYRVDLSAGDTMLIPAGWIHAVWTPENSLVIGGNFLTRIHYGMQIKITKIEKDTKVARKFRYPFFQKLMWFTALKYIHDDPLPVPVVEAFHQDENYRFYRKNPIHYEFGENANTEEPGSGHYNARYYSQAELDGLPELAKYLLRTALIGQELLTEGVSFDARKAVKASIPISKVQGAPDALDIVKIFGIWLAWKRGNERAANWAYPDMYPSSTKADAKWTLQPERNAGKKSILESYLFPRRRTPRKMSAPIVEVETREQPAAEQITPSAPQPSFPTTPKSSGLGPKRIACDACRKRRIRCRHKDDSVETKKKNYAMRVEMNTKQRSNTEASEDAVTPVSRGFAQVDSTPSTTGPNFLGKKGRSKACDECRKSKRRCIHDEFGRIDPVKAQEPSKPRVAGAAKRPRTSNEGFPEPEPLLKKPKQETEDRDEYSHFTEKTDMVDDSMIDPALACLNTAMSNVPDSPSYQSSRALVNDDNTEVNFSSDLAAHSAVLAASAALNAVNQAEAEAAMTASAHRPSEDPNQETSHQEHATNGRYHLDASISFPSNSPCLKVPQPSADGPTTAPFLASPPTSHEGDLEVSPITTENGAIDLQTPKSSSRHSSRQPRQTERYPADTSSTVKTKASPVARRLSSSTVGSTTNAAPHSGSSKNQHTMQSSRRGSGGIETTKTSPALTAKSVSPNVRRSLERERKSQSFGEIDADPESLKLIRALHEEEFGLRRRGTRT